MAQGSGQISRQAGRRSAALRCLRYAAAGKASTRTARANRVQRLTGRTDMREVPRLNNSCLRAFYLAINNKHRYNQKPHRFSRNGKRQDESFSLSKPKGRAGKTTIAAHLGVGRRA